jgi:hypothetical protein
MLDDYYRLLESTLPKASARGLTSTTDLAPHLFEYQKHCVDFALRVGASGCFLNTGLGKTEVQLEFCRQAAQASNGRALLLTPLAVAQQTKRRADRWGYESRVIRDMSTVGDGINICNYDRLEKLDPSDFGVVALDESSLLKSFTGATTRKLIEAFRNHRFKIAATATPAPNDHMELGQHSEFLGVMPSNEMLMRWFIADQTEMGRYRIKGHAANAFWDWMATWSRAADVPSDLGGSDEGFDLPPIKMFRHKSRQTEIVGGEGLFASISMSATSMHDVKRQTSEVRSEVIARLVLAEPDEPWILWCDTNYEADALQVVIPDAVEVRGSHSVEQKEETLEAFSLGKIKYLIAKPQMCGFGLDWSHCARMAFVGRSYSYETFYQAVRRCQRFGQKRQVHVHLAVAEGEAEIGRVVDRKAEDHAEMKRAMTAAMARSKAQSSTLKAAYDPQFIAKVPSWLKSVA